MSTFAPTREDSDFETIVGEAVGFASMCWSETPTGEFDSTAAKSAVDAILTAAYAHYNRWESDTDDQKSQATEATITYSDLHLREMALSFATQHSDGLGAASVVMKAEAFLKFLQNGKAPKPEGSRS